MRSARASSESRDQPRRRRLQFSLRSLMMFTFFCCAGLVVWDHYLQRYLQRQHALEQVARLHGNIKIQPVGNPLGGWVFGKEFCDGVVSIELDGPQADNAWASLTELPDLQELTVVDSSLDDAHLVHFARLQGLKDLALFHARVTDSGIAHLSGLTQLNALWLGRTAVGDAGLAHLSQLRHLKQLDLHRSNITDLGMHSLAGMSELTMLDLNDTQLTDAGIASLVGLTKLSELRLENTNVTEACLTDLKKLPALAKVSLSGTHVIPSAVRRALPQLGDGKQGPSRLVLRRGERLSRPFSRELHATVPLEFDRTSLLDVFDSLSERGVPIRLDESSVPAEVGRASVTCAFHVSTAAAIEQILEKFDLHGEIEGNTIHVYRGPVTAHD